MADFFLDANTERNQVTSAAQVPVLACCCSWPGHVQLSPVPRPNNLVYFNSRSMRRRAKLPHCWAGKGLTGLAGE